MCFTPFLEILYSVENTSPLCLEASRYGVMLLSCYLTLWLTKASQIGFFFSFDLFFFELDTHFLPKPFVKFWKIISLLFRHCGNLSMYWNWEGSKDCGNVPFRRQLSGLWPCRRRWLGRDTPWEVQLIIFQGALHMSKSEMGTASAPKVYAMEHHGLPEICTVLACWRVFLDPCFTNVMLGYAIPLLLFSKLYI